MVGVQIFEYPLCIARRINFCDFMTFSACSIVLMDLISSFSACCGMVLVRFASSFHLRICFTSASLRSFHSRSTSILYISLCFLLTYFNILCLGLVFKCSYWFPSALLSHPHTSTSKIVGRCRLFISPGVSMALSYSVATRAFAMYPPRVSSLDAYT